MCLNLIDNSLKYILLNLMLCRSALKFIIYLDNVIKVSTYKVLILKLLITLNISFITHLMLHQLLEFTITKK